MQATAARHTVQPFLDDRIALGADPSVIVPTVNHNIDWDWFRAVEREFLRARKVHNDRKNKRQGPGRPRNPGGPGRSGYGFFGLLRAFLFAPLFEVPATAATIKRALHANPAYLVECAFDPIMESRKVVRINPVPSFWAINEFDNVMNEAGLWDRVREITTRKAIRLGAIPKEGVLGVDPTPVKAYARPEKRKRCDCADQSACNHRRREADRDARYYKKGGVRILRAYRPIILAELLSGVPLKSILPSDTRNVDAERFEKVLQDVKNDRSLSGVSFREMIADAEFDSRMNRANSQRVLGIPLYAPPNPRRRKGRPVGRRGIREIDPAGVPVCEHGQRFEFVGLDRLRASSVFRAPRDDRGRPICRTCPIRCTEARGGRYFRVPLEVTPWIDLEMPQHSLAFKMKLALRTEIERVISRLKILGAGAVTKQGRKKVGGRITRAIIVAQMIAVVAMRMNQPDAIRAIRTLRGPPLAA